MTPRYVKQGSEGIRPDSGAIPRSRRRAFGVWCPRIPVQEVRSHQALPQLRELTLLSVGGGGFFEPGK